MRFHPFLCSKLYNKKAFKIVCMFVCVGGGGVVLGITIVHY